MTMYAAQCRVEVLRRPLYFHTDGFRGNWGEFIVVAGNAEAIDEDVLIQNNGGVGDGIVFFKVITQVTSAGNDRYLIVRIVSTSGGGVGSVYLHNVGTTLWDLILGPLSSEGTWSIAIPAGTYDQIILKSGNVLNIVWDYVAISRYDVQLLDSPNVTVHRMDERNGMSNAEVTAVYRPENVGINCRDHVKIWLAGGPTSTLTKQFTGLIVQREFPRQGTVLQRLRLECMSYMIYIADREITLKDLDGNTGVTSAVISTIQDLIEESLITVRSVLFYTTTLYPNFDNVNSYEALRTIANDPLFPCSMFVDFAGDLNYFTYGTRTSDESIVQSDLINYVRVDDGHPGTIQNSVTMYGGAGWWPTEHDGLSYCESFTNSDLVESSIEYIWYDQPAGGAGIHNLRAQKGGVVGTSYLLDTYDGTGIPDSINAIIIKRTFYPWVDGNKWSEQLFYWKATVDVNSIVILMTEFWGINYYMTCLKPDYGAAFTANAWGGLPYTDTEVTMVPYGDQALNTEGKPLWVAVGNPHWDKIRSMEIQFHFIAPQQTPSVILDGLYFAGFSWMGGHWDTASIETYGSCVRSYEGNYGSNEECASAAESIVHVHRNPIVRMENCEIKPRVTLEPTERIKTSCVEIDDKLVIDEIALQYDNARLGVTVQLGPTRPDYISYETQERVRRQKTKEVDRLANRRENVFYGRYSKYLPE